MSLPETCPFCGAKRDYERPGRWVGFTCRTSIHVEQETRRNQSHTCEDLERTRLADRILALEAEAKQISRHDAGRKQGKRMEKTENINFGQAVEALKRGRRVSRAGWNGKGMYLWLLPAAKVKAEWCREPHLKAVAEQNGGEIDALGSIRMMTADRKVLTGWLASQTDILSEDWCIIPE